MKKTNKTVSAVVALCIGFFGAANAPAQNLSHDEFARGGGKGGGKISEPVAPSYQLQDWMHSDVGEAWAQGYFGAKTRITFIDDFASGQSFSGNLGTGVQSSTHGEWTSEMGSMIAPEAKIIHHDFSSTSAVGLSRRNLDILNLSYGMMAKDGYSSVNWSPRENSIISAARSGKAVVVKAAGNDYGIAIGQADSSGMKDYLNRDLIGAESAIFVGALSSNGSVDHKASIASYSNIAGDNITVQEQFLVVGVEGSKTGLYGTSFAAPIVAGYSSILGSKFTKATSAQIANRLLDTARTDTLNNYTVSVHGQGEASLSRALAPNSIQ